MRCYLTRISLLAVTAAACSLSPVAAAEPAPPAKATAVKNAAAPMPTWRASDLEKMNVRNSAGDKIGAIEDLVVTQDGRIAYAALGFGGFVGIGEKLFAVPFKDLQIERDAKNDEHYLMLNVTKEELKNAPGFDKSHWPDFADPNFTQKLDNYHWNTHNKVGQR